MSEKTFEEINKLKNSGVQMKEVTEINIELLAHPIVYGIFTIIVWELSKQLVKVVCLAFKK